MKIFALIAVCMLSLGMLTAYGSGGYGGSKQSPALGGQSLLLASIE